MVLLFIVVAAVSYLLGCANGAIIISKTLKKDDVRQHGSGNAGLTNFQRTYGGLSTLAVVLLDLGKTIAAILIARALLSPYGLSDEAAMLAGGCTMLGHMFPAMFGFKGGKGILSAAAWAIMMDWRVFAVGMGLFLIIVAMTRLVSLGSIIGVAGFSGSCVWVFWDKPFVWIMALVCGGLMIYKHKANIGRLLKGTEPKLSFHKKTSNQEGRP